MKFSEECRSAAAEWWEGSFVHPFVQGIGDGTLPIDRFKYYVLQDSYYLTHFAKVQSFGAAYAKDLYTTGRMASHAQGTYEAEMALHREFAELLEISEEEHKAFKPSPTAYSYTSHMYRSVLSGNFAEILAALLPCYWLYYEVGEKLLHCDPGHPIYQKWIGTYGGDWFRQQVEEQINRFDELAENSTEEVRAKMKENFVISSYYEYQFWGMAYRKEGWSDSAIKEVEECGASRHNG
ncbi:MULTISPECIES: thiaminase II [Bacillus]|uniref:thiaminase II n=1 Tax=Bacillus TaxID=1386 RepID=UPI000D024E67|nr:thiaminase II [Bacillus subtilis]PRS92337.1 thiaminase II [Bacillus subtilis subsp. subtilis]PRS95462.1 thiaminase II [Bacillus subtilis subsp. subtilis]